MADVDRVDEWVAHQTADQAHDTVGGEHAGRGVGVARCLRALHVVHGLDQVVDAEWNGGHENDAEKLEPGEHMIDSGNRYREAEVRERALQLLQTQSPIAKAEQIGAPGDNHADGNGNEPGRNPPWVFEAT